MGAASKIGGVAENGDLVTFREQKDKAIVGINRMNFTDSLLLGVGDPELIWRI